MGVPADFIVCLVTAGALMEVNPVAGNQTSLPFALTLRASVA